MTVTVADAVEGVVPLPQPLRVLLADLRGSERSDRGLETVTRLSLKWSREESPLRPRPKPAAQEPWAEEGAGPAPTASLGGFLCVAPSLFPLSSLLWGLSFWKCEQGSCQPMTDLDSGNPD